MRISQIRTRAFGPFGERKLELAPGMTVIVGDNEAGKSSWHAAIYAAVCGMRRGQGRRAEDREFMRRHRPWDGDSWGVESVIDLADGRTIEITHDLDGNVDCRAVDVGLGRRDVSAEIMFEGSADASRWVGLDRHTFLATACVGQAEVLAVVQSAEALQEHLQRAAATAGTDETAARALALLEGYQRGYVGSDRINSVKPLRRAMVAVAAAEASLSATQTAHADYLSHLAEADRLVAVTAAARRRLEVLNAAEAERRAADAAGLVEHVGALAAQLEGDPIDLESVRSAGSRVSVAVAAWRASPAPQPLAGAASDELGRALSALPAAPVGNLTPAAAVASAEMAWRSTRTTLRAHLGSEPPAAALPPTSLSSSELRDLARDLNLVVPVVDPELQRRHAELTQRLATTPERKVNVPLVIAALAAAVAGVAVSFFTTPLFTLIGLAAAAVLAAIGVRKAFGNARSQVLEEVQQVNTQLGTSQVAAEAAQRTVDEARNRAGAAGLSADSAALLARAAQVDNALAAAEQRRIWAEARAEYEQRLGAAEAALRSALMERGMVEAGDLEAAVDGYRAACAERAQVAQQASRRPDLERELAGRREAEAAFTAAAGRHQQAAEALLGAAREHGFEGSDPEAALALLEEWQKANQERLELAERQVRVRGELDALLAGRTQEEIEQKADRARRSAEVASADLPADEVAAEAATPDLANRLKEARASADTARVAAASARGALMQLGATSDHVAASEEALVAARAELARIRRLEATLSTTHGFLERAQERVHRDIAPVLEGTLRAWLPRITAGRYTDASIDPETLEAKVKDASGQFREAGLLSQGTREQVYLLLRMALVTHLTKPGEVCPLIFDDVTVQTDSPRTQAILDLLHEISADRQVIVFSQEEDVRRWAGGCLDPDRDQLIALENPVSAA